MTAGGAAAHTRDECVPSCPGIDRTMTERPEEEAATDSALDAGDGEDVGLHEKDAADEEPAVGVNPNDDGPSIGSAFMSGS